MFSRFSTRPASKPRVLLLAACLLLPACLNLVAAAASLAGWEAWPQAQQLSVQSSGLARVELPADTLDRLSTDFSDLRLVGADASEIPWTVLLPHPSRSSELLVSKLQVRLNTASTVVRFSAPQASAALISLQLLTPAVRFNKPLSLEGSDDGASWSLILDRVPVYCMAPGQPVSELSLPPSRFAHYRLTLGDSGSAPIPVTGLRLGLESVDTTPAAVGPLTLLGREEVAGETRLRLRFAARGAHLYCIGLSVDDSVFCRPLRLVERSYVGGLVEERVLARGLASRVAVDGTPSGSSASINIFTIEQRLPARELLLVIENGDSPPLSIRGLLATYRPLHLAFPSPSSGQCTLLAGALQVKHPSYDLASLNAQLSVGATSHTSTPAEFSAFADNPGFRPDDRLPVFPLVGASLDIAAWSGAREVLLSAPGVQQLELDSALLAASSPRYHDLRLVKGDSQVPYIIERCSFGRLSSLVLRPFPAPRPGYSQWSLELPAAGLPFTSLALVSQTALFQRHFELFEERRDSRGEPVRVVIGAGTWSRHSAKDSARFVLTIYQTPRSASLILETSDGDNLPITLDRAEVLLPAVRLHFKTADTTPLNVLFGNSQVSAPSYDLHLVASQILSAPHSEASLGPAQPLAPAGDSLLIRLSRQSSVLFWSALILVAGTLLFIIARLLPKTTK